MSIKKEVPCGDQLIISLVVVSSATKILTFAIYDPIEKQPNYMQDFCISNSECRSDSRTGAAVETIFVCVRPQL